jgi:hypothetical protein
MSASEIDLIMARVQQLPPNEQLLVIKRVADLLTLTKPVGESRGLVYGRYRQEPGRMSDEDDFRIAEWHPSEEELNGP